MFLASPTDFRYEEMKRNKQFLDSIGWQTFWLEFDGGHAPAPAATLKEAVAWLEGKLS